MFNILCSYFLCVTFAIIGVIKKSPDDMPFMIFSLGWLILAHVETLHYKLITKKKIKE